MQKFRAVACAAFVLALGANSATEQEATVPPPTDTTSSADEPPFISFDEFLQGVQEATFEDFVGRDGVGVRDEQSFEEMRTHILIMYDGVEQVSTFVVEGSYFDCITIDSQPSVRLLDLGDVVREPPDSSLGEEVDGEAPGEGANVESPLREGLIDPYGNPIECPEDTIPMARLTLETLTRFETLDAFFGKTPDGSGRVPTGLGQEEPPAVGDEEHDYAVGYQDVTNFGGNSWLNLWNPAINEDEIFSLSQQWYATFSGDTVQTVEGGWQRYPEKYDAAESVLFIYYTADNYGSTGCYNLDCAGFVQINSNWYLAGPWTQYSTAEGTQWGFEMQWKLFEGNWWLFLKGPGAYEAVGYYPASLYNDGPMATSAEEIIYGGETAGTTSMPEMGSGAFAEQGWQRAAFQNTIFYIPLDENDGTGIWAELDELESAPDCYTVDVTLADRGGSWGTYMFFGGPGGDSC